MKNSSNNVYFSEEVQVRSKDDDLSSMKVDDILDDIRMSLPVNWVLSDIISLSETISLRWNERFSSENDVIDLAMDLAVSEFSPSGHADNVAIKEFCGLAMTLSFVAMSSQQSAGLYKAVVSATHIAIDILRDYDLGVDYCSRIAPLAKVKQDWKVAILVIGDLGIAKTRGKRFRDALAPLKEAVRLSVEQSDFDSAARYGSELGRSYFELDDYKYAAKMWQTALEHAERSQNAELQTQILSNIRALSSLHN